MKTNMEKIINKNIYLSIKQVIKQQNLCQLKEKKSMKCNSTLSLLIKITISKYYHHHYQNHH